MGRGGWNRTERRTVESSLTVDLNFLRGAGYLASGSVGQLAWACGENIVARVSYRLTNDTLTLAYKRRIGREPWIAVDQDIPITWRPCKFGGVRPYFVCPGNAGEGLCSRLVVKMHSAGCFFLCRHCSRLVYASQRERTFGRAMLRAERARKRIGGDFPFRPKGMWQRTFERLLAAAELADYKADRTLLLRFEQMFR